MHEVRTSLALGLEQTINKTKKLQQNQRHQCLCCKHIANNVSIIITCVWINRKNLCRPSSALCRRNLHDLASFSRIILFFGFHKFIRTYQFIEHKASRVTWTEQVFSSYFFLFWCHYLFCFGWVWLFWIYIFSPAIEMHYCSSQNLINHFHQPNHKNWQLLLTQTR